MHDTLGTFQALYSFNFFNFFINHLSLVLHVKCTGRQNWRLGTCSLIYSALRLSKSLPRLVLYTSSFLGWRHCGLQRTLYGMGNSDQHPIIILIHYVYLCSSLCLRI
jgi:hypothetical protein